MKSILSIAGSDPSGGAGIQADLAAFAYAGVQGNTVITCVTAQNRKEVSTVHPVPLEVIESQLESVFDEKKILACKTGMLYSPDIVRLISEKSRNWDFPLIVDPVMRASAGQDLSLEGFTDSLKEHLIPRATVFVPNIPEAKKIAEMEIDSLEDVEEACKKIHGLGCDYVLIKGGHLEEHRAADVLFDGREFRVYLAKSRPGEVHGSGCTFSALICAFMALGMNVADAVEEAKLHMGIYFERGGEFSKGFTKPEEIPAPAMTGEEQQVYGLLSKAADELPGILPVSFLPEVGINIGYALTNADAITEVCALQGRFVRAGDRIVRAGEIAFGGSTHVARIILTAMKFDGAKRSAMNIRYTPAIIRASRAANLDIAAFDRRLEPKGASTMEWGVKSAIKKGGGVPDIIYDKGGVGKEPMIRILGSDPLDVLYKVRTIAKNITE